MQVVCILFTLFWIVLLARIIMSWLPPPQSGLGRGVAEVVWDLTEPVLKLVRGLLPPVRMGAAALDLSPIVVFIALGVIARALGCGIGF